MYNQFNKFVQTFINSAIKMCEDVVDESVNIHSGHFMTSNPHTDDFGPCEDLGLGISLEGKIINGTFNLIESASTISQEEEKPVTFYKFGQKKTKSIAIDVSLRKLNKCIRVAYNRMITPKWKDFKGFRLRLKQRIRLNNVIWRAYYLQIQCKQDKNNEINFFVIPLEGNVAKKDKPSVLCSVDWKAGTYSYACNVKRWRNYKERRRQLRRNSHHMDVVARIMLATSFVDMLYEKKKQRMLHILSKLEPESEIIRPKEISPYMDPFSSCFYSSRDNLLELLPQTDVKVAMDETVSTLATDSIEDFTELMKGYNITKEYRNLLKDYNEDENVFTDSVKTYNDSVKEEETSELSHTQYMPLYAQQVDPATYQLQPTRQSSSIPTMFASDSSNPTYSVAEYGAPMHIQRSAMISDGYFHQFVTSNMPQPNVLSYLPNSPIQPSSPWCSPTSPLPICGISNTVSPCTFTGAPSPACNIIHAGTPSAFTAHSPSSVLAFSPPQLNLAPLLPSSRDLFSTNIANKGTLNEYSVQQQKEAWLLTTPSCASSTETIGAFGTDRVWKRVVASSSLSHSAPQSVISQTSQLSDEEERIYQDTAEGSSTIRDPHSSSPIITVKRENEKETQLNHHYNPLSIGSSIVDSTMEPLEKKRLLHLSAEQHRRSNLKDGFDKLMSLLPNLYPLGSKLTNAAVLIHAAKHVRDLQSRIETCKNKRKELKEQVEQLNEKISSMQTSLPLHSSNAVGNQQCLFEKYFAHLLQVRCENDPRFWIMARMMKPLLKSLYDLVSSKKHHPAEDLTLEQWIAAKFQPKNLRPFSTNFIVELARKTSEIKNMENYIESEAKKYTRRS